MTSRNDDRKDTSLLARRALERATDGAEPRVGALLDAVPRMLDEARRRRSLARRRDALTAAIPLARFAIPRLAAATALLVAVSAVLVLTTEARPPRASSSLEEVLVAGGGVSEELVLGSILDAEVEP